MSANPSLPHARRSAKLLGCYVLPGGVRDPRPIVAQAHDAEALGLGTAWIGERYDTKDLPSLAGALTQTTTALRIGAAATHTQLRHPMVLASMGQTLQALSGGRFLLGFGRSAAWRWRDYGEPMPTLASLGDVAQILRRLWAGETVGYDGPAGRFPRLRLPQQADIDAPPLLLAAVGPKTLALAGERFDGAILHPFLTPEAVADSVKIVREAAARAGRDLGRIRCYAAVVAAPDRWARDVELAVYARGAGYFHVHGLGDALVAANGWDQAELIRYRNQPRLVALGDQQADKALPRDELVEMGRSLPDHWLPASSATGTAAQCAARLAEYLDAGADELVLHGTTAAHLGPLVKQFVVLP
ncbi:MAG TPA: TIGR03857 family LLM class F420-dependent oxidoreductase [Acidimicrobiales bacterium]|jgi:probable F420-dependent oxidoreductase